MASEISSLSTNPTIIKQPSNRSTMEMTTSLSVGCFSSDPLILYAKPSPFLGMLGSFFSTEQRFQAFTRLSRAMRTVYFVAMPLHCCNDEVEICLMAPKPSRVDYVFPHSELDRVRAGLTVAPFVRTLHASFDPLDIKTRAQSFENQRDTINQSIKAALFGSSLRELHVHEYIDDTRINQSVIGTMLSELASLNQFVINSLQTLSIDIESIDDFDDPLFSRFTNEWAGLSRLTKLTTLNLSLPLALLDEFTTMETIYHHFPSSLTSLIMNTGDEASNAYHNGWQNLFRSDTFLPHLQILDVGAIDVSKVLSTTIMRSTGRVRPIKSLHVSASSLKHIALFDALTCLKLKVSSGKVFRSFSSLSQTSMPHLSHVEFNVKAEDGDELSPVIIYLSKRPIIELKFKIVSGDLKPLNDEAVRALSNMHTLTKLILKMGGGKSLFVNSDIHSLLPSNSFPSLLRFHLTGCKCSVRQLEVLIAACPALKEADFSYVGDEFPVVALLGRYCREIRKITIEHEQPSSHRTALNHRISLQEVQKSFHDYDTSTWFQELFYVSTNLSFDHAALHYLLSLLRSAPDLRIFWSPIRSNFDTILRRSLPHLIHLNKLDFIPKKIAHRLMSGMAGEQMKKGESYQAMFLKCSHTISKSSPDNIPWSQDCLLGELYGYHVQFLEFKETSLNRLSGRAAWFECCARSLKPNAVRRLSQWDSGDYTYQNTRAIDSGYDSPCSQFDPDNPWK